MFGYSEKYAERTYNYANNDKNYQTCRKVNSPCHASTLQYMGKWEEERWGGGGGGVGTISFCSTEKTREARISLNFQRFLRSKYLHSKNKKTVYGSLCFFSSENIFISFLQLFNFHFSYKGVAV
jgi:hypothetical protein